VAPQALFLLNDAFTIAQARGVAQRVALESTTSEVGTRIRSAYERVLGRMPTREEFDVASGVFAGENSSEGLERLCQLLLCSNEFFYVD
jgi:BMFP domain-containing protein YqiC